MNPGNGSGTNCGSAAVGLRGKARMALARRDLLEFVRDRRTMFVTLLLPMAMYPILALSSALGVRTALSDIDARQAPTNLTVVLSGRPWNAQAFAKRVGGLARPENGQNKLDWPASIAFGFAAAEEAHEAVEDGRADLWIDVPEHAIDGLDGEGTVSIEAQGPTSRVLAPRVREQFTAVMRGLADDARRRRIDRAGLPASLLEPVDVRFIGKADAPGTIPTRDLLPTVAGGVFVLLAVLTMTGAFYPAIDAIAGEKERGTIETLLIAPCAGIDIVAGKFLAVWAVTLATLVANVISICLTAAVSLRFLPKGGSLLPAGSLPMVVVVSLLAFIGLSAVAAAMCLAVTTASKSGKEAQNTLTPVLLFASALAGAGLVADLRSSPFLTAVPFAGQVALARATLMPDDRAAGRMDSGAVDLAHQPAGWLVDVERLTVPLATSLISSAVLAWLLLRGTAAMLTDEEILFRGPDVAGGVLTRPARRRRPTIAQGLIALVIGLAGLWYAQGFSPADFALAIPVQQAAAVLLPLALLLAWQRVDLRRTFGLRWPAATGKGTGWRAAASLVGAGLVGAGLFVLGAAVLLAIRGTHVSDEAKSLAEKLLAMMRDRPLWLSWALISLLPAIGEELLFRGWVQSALVGASPSRGRITAGVIAQAACFALFHLLPERMPQTFALGLVAGAIALATRSLLPAIICHAAHNSMPLLMLWAAGGLSASTDTSDAIAAATGAVSLPIWTVAGAVASVAGGIALIWLAVRAWGCGRGPASVWATAAIGLVVCMAAAEVAGSRRAAAAEPTVGPAAMAGRVRVGVAPISAALEWTGDQPVGAMVDVWEDLARRLGVDTVFVREPTFGALLKTVAAGEVDVGLGPIAITEEREKLIDLTHPIFHSGMRIAVRQRIESGVMPALRSLLTWDLVGLLAIMLLLGFASGHVLWWTQRRHNAASFPQPYLHGVGEAIWWIISTIVSGGCDNKHVVGVLGRAIALAWMIGGIMLVAAFTSVLTATMTAERVSGSIHGPRDLMGRTVGCQEGSVSGKDVRLRGGIPREFGTVPAALDALALGLVEAVVSENQSLKFLIHQPQYQGIKVVGVMFDSFDYGLGLPSGSPLRENLNTAILRMREDGTIERIKEHWLGRQE